MLCQTVKNRPNPCVDDEIYEDLRTICSATEKQLQFLIKQAQKDRKNINKFKEDMHPIEYSGKSKGKLSV